MNIAFLRLYEKNSTARASRSISFSSISLIICIFLLFLRHPLVHLLHHRHRRHSIHIKPQLLMPQSQRNSHQLDHIKNWILDLLSVAPEPLPGVQHQMHSGTYTVTMTSAPAFLASVITTRLNENLEE